MWSLRILLSTKLKSGHWLLTLGLLTTDDDRILSSRYWHIATRCRHLTTNFPSLMTYFLVVGCILHMNSDWCVLHKIQTGVYCTNKLMRTTWNLDWSVFHMNKEWCVMPTNFRMCAYCTKFRLVRIDINSDWCVLHEIQTGAYCK